MQLFQQMILFIFVELVNLRKHVNSFNDDNISSTDVHVCPKLGKLPPNEMAQIWDF